MKLQKLIYLCCKAKREYQLSSPARAAAPAAPPTSTTGEASATAVAAAVATTRIPGWPVAVHRMFFFHEMYRISTYSCLVLLGLAVDTVLISSEISANLSWILRGWMRNVKKPKQVFITITTKKKNVFLNAIKKNEKTEGKRSPSKLAHPVSTTSGLICQQRPWHE